MTASEDIPMNQERSLRVAAALAAELQLEVDERRRAGTTLPAWERYAVVFASPERVRPYLPANYEVVGWISSGEHVVTLIAGHDNAGWTLDDYVIPRLGSGLYLAVELKEDK